MSTLGDLYLSPAPGSKGPCVPGAIAFYPGQNVDVTGTEFAPGSTVALTYDDGTTITPAGSASVRSDGSFTTQLTVPSSATEGGIAEFKATGSDIDGGGRYALDVFGIASAGVGCSDTTPAAITIALPKNNATYAPGSSVLASYRCDDGRGSGVVSCAGDVKRGQPIDTTSPGPHHFTVTSWDLAGNKATSTVRYSISGS